MRSSSCRRARVHAFAASRPIGARSTARCRARASPRTSRDEKDAIQRGMVVVRPGTFAPTSSISLHLGLLASASDALAHDDDVKVHTGTAEVMARVNVLERDAIAPGESGWVQLRLAGPLAVAVGDRVVLRRPSPSETLGGGTIADTSSVRARRRADVVASLERRSAPRLRRGCSRRWSVPRTAAEAGERSGLGAAERVCRPRRVLATARRSHWRMPLLRARHSRLSHACAALLRAGTSRARSGPASRAKSAHGCRAPAEAFRRARREARRRRAHSLRHAALLALPEHTRSSRRAETTGSAPVRCCCGSLASPTPRSSRATTDSTASSSRPSTSAETSCVSVPGGLPARTVAGFVDVVVTELTRRGDDHGWPARGTSPIEPEACASAAAVHGRPRPAAPTGHDRILVVTPDAARARIRTLIHAGEDRS